MRSCLYVYRAVVVVYVSLSACLQVNLVYWRIFLGVCRRIVPFLVSWLFLWFFDWDWNILVGFFRFVVARVRRRLVWLRWLAFRWLC